LGQTRYFKLNKPITWAEPSEVVEMENTQLGRIQVKRYRVKNNQAIFEILV
jgi:hypothetical protein